MGIEVDVLQGKKRERMDGISKYYGEVIARLEKDVDFKIIGYSGNNLSRPGKALSLVRYPFMAAREARKDSVKHCASMVEAHLLNYLDLSPSVVTCYDIFPLLPGAYPLPERAFLKFAARGMLKADRIITISGFSADEIASRLGYPREKISIAYPGVDHDRFKPMAMSMATREGLGMSRDVRIILYVGMEQPRKNLPVLIRAFGRLRRNGVEARLVKIGRPHRAEDRKKLMDVIREEGLQDDVTIIDYVSEDDLPLFYNLADLFVFPSSYEGFGLPPLEAMACGCPVITSDASVFLEVGGEASLKAHVGDDEDLAHQMENVLENEALASRLRERGLERAREFDWRRTAQETLNVYRQFAD